MDLHSFTKPVAISGILFLVACSPEPIEPMGIASNNTELSTPDTGTTTDVTDLSIWPELDIKVKTDPKLEAQIIEILSGMTLEQKVAQMVQPEIRTVTVDDMRRYGFGSFLNGGGAFPQNNKHATPDDWIQLAEDMYQASVDDSLDGSTIPTMWGTDAVHGHNNVIGATLFPHNIGLGAAHNPDLIEKIAGVTATEVMVTGIDWVFAPTVAVVRDDRWGRTYEGYSEDPEIVRAYSKSIVNGLQGYVDEDFLGDQRVIATVKHFLGDGGTQGGVDQGDNTATEQELFDLHAQGYIGGLSAGAQTVMASFNSWHGKKMHGHKYLLTDVLKNKMGFDGLVVGDWLGHGQVAGCTNENCSTTINAGLDIFMASGEEWKKLLENTIEQVKSGEIALSRIDDAVSRILRVKLRAGIFDKPSPANRKLSGQLDLIGAPEHRALARQAVRESLVLLKNNNDLLPLSPKQKILVAGDAAHNIGKQSGGWTITWQGLGNVNEDFPGGTSIYQGLEQAVNDAGGEIELSVDGSFTSKPDVAVVVFGEEPYAEGSGDRDDVDYQKGDKQDLALLKKLQAQGIPVVSVFISGRPLWVNRELNASDAFVAAWLPGSEGQGVADVLLAQANGEIDHDFTGKLSFSWPARPDQTAVNRFDQNYEPLLPYGFGLSYGDADVLASDLDESENGAVNQASNLALFEFTVKKPWKLKAGGEQPTVESNSSILDFETVKVSTLDRNVQEDARRIQFKGNGKGSVGLVSDQAIDLLSRTGESAVLSVTVRVDTPPTEPVDLTMRCGDDCAASIDITTALRSAASATWFDLTVDLRCLQEQGVDLTRTTSPFELSTESRLDLSFSRIVIESQSTAPANIGCD